MKERAWADGYRTTTVCIDGCPDGEMKGRFYNLYMGEGKQFNGLLQFLVQMEQVLDSMDFPRAFNTIRTFAKPPPTNSGAATAEIPVGRLATFKVRILFRQNASWQGSVLWVEGKQEQSFRSALELLLLMDNALEQEKQAV